MTSRMQDAKVEARIRRKFRLVAVELDERRRRQWAAAEAQEVGWGGISLVARATGLSRPRLWLDSRSCNCRRRAALLLPHVCGARVVGAGH